MSDARRGLLGRRAGALAERNFRLFLGGYLTSLVGSSMVPVALTFAVLNEGHSTAEVGYVLASETVPLIALLLVGGVIADRVPRRAAMLSADVLRFVSEGLLAGLLLSGSPPLWSFMVLAGVLGAGQAFFNPAITGLMPEIVDPEHLQSANALRGVATSIGQIVGPSIAGVIVATGGAGWAIGVDALTYLISAGCLVGLELPPRQPTEHGSALGDLLHGWREFSSRSWLWAIVAQFAVFIAFTFAPFMVLGAVVAHDRLGGAGPWGLILAAFGAGGIVGGLASSALRPKRPLLVGTFGVAFFALVPAAIAVPIATPLIALTAAIAGIGLAFFDTMWETTMQREVPSEALSRVSAYDWLGSAGLLPVGYALVGPLAALLGIRVMLLLGAALTLLTCGAVLCVREVRTIGAVKPEAGGEQAAAEAP